MTKDDGSSIMKVQKEKGEDNMTELSGGKVTDRTKKSNLQTRYNSAISNLLLVIAFSVINIVLLLTDGSSYFLFSAFIPYFAVDYGMYFCGLYPEEYYADVPDMEFADKSFLAVTVVAAAVILLIYLLCWYLAKKKKIGAVIFALVFFLADTVAMLVLSGISSDSFVDILVHIWVIYYLIMAIVTYNRMKKAPDVSPETEMEEESTDAGGKFTGNRGILRMAEDVKCKIFLEAEYSGMHIVYRRVKRTNELVVNGGVYDEYVALAEFAHKLTADVNGHKVEASYDGGTCVRILVDSCEIAKKRRLF